MPMSYFDVHLTFSVDAGDADEAAAAFKEQLAKLRNVELRVQNARSGEITYVDVNI